ATYRDAHRTIHQIGRELAVDYVVQGGLRKDANTIRFNADFIRISDERRLWNEQYETTLPDFSQVQNQIIDKMASTLGLKVSAADLDALTQVATLNATAREAYLQGVAQLERGTELDLRNALNSFQKAVSADPQYPRAYAALAEAEIRSKGDFDSAEKN